MVTNRHADAIAGNDSPVAPNLACRLTRHSQRYPGNHAAAGWRYYSCACSVITILGRFTRHERESHDHTLTRRSALAVRFLVVLQRASAFGCSRPGRAASAL